MAVQIKLRREASHDTLRVLTMEQWEFWKSQGYVTIKQAIPRE